MVTTWEGGSRCKTGDMSQLITEILLFYQKLTDIQIPFEIEN